MMRMGIMGGTFDPIHCGHISVAEAVRCALALDGIVLLPSGEPPHKRNFTGKYARLEMARLAAGRAGFDICAAEVERQGATFTIDTLRDFSRTRPGDSWTYIIGMDTLGVLDQWRDFSQVAQLCDFAIVRREGSPDDGAICRIEQLSAAYGARIALTEVSGPAISSTEIRGRVARGESIAGLVPPAVERYIHEKGLYLCAMDEDALLERLLETLGSARFAHTLGVAGTAEELAHRYGVDPARARLAGLLHDCAKGLSPQRMRSLVRQAGIAADEAELATESILHAPAGAALAALEYGVQDGAILSAIRNHTVGGAKLCGLDAVIYVADFIEPGRKPFAGLERARAAAGQNLLAAAKLCAQCSVRHVVEAGKQPHPRTLKMIDEYTTEGFDT